MSAEIFFITDSGLARASSYEKQPIGRRYGHRSGGDARGAGAFGRAASAALAAVGLALALAGCGTLPSNVGKADEIALPLSPDSPLVKIAQASSPGEDQTGVRLMPLGPFSLDTRVQLAQRATSSLDVQYYQFENDNTGRLLMQALRDAAV